MTIGTIILLLASLPANLFLFLHLIWAPPWLSKQPHDSMFIFLLIGGIAGIIDLALLRMLGISVPVAIRNFVWAVLCLQLYYALVLMWRINRPRWVKIQQEEENASTEL